MNSVIRVLIADDEPLAREALRRLLAVHSEFKVAGEADNGEEVLSQLKKNPVDVIFLDIEMPVLTGLEAAGRIAKLKDPPYLVFVTAYHKYAIEAFEANAMDYILKPVDPARLKKTLDRIRERLLGPGPKAVGPGPSERLTALEDALIQKGVIKKIAGHKRNSKDRLVLDPSEVYYFYVHLSEVLARLENDELIVNSTLKELLANLDPARFVQTHKSHLVNVDRIEKVSPMFSGNFEIFLKHPAKLKIPLSRRYAKTLKARLGNW